MAHDRRGTLLGLSFTVATLLASCASPTTSPAVEASDRRSSEAAPSALLPAEQTAPKTAATLRGATAASSPPAATSAGAPGDEQRRYHLYRPARLDGSRPAPLFVFLHGLGASGSRLAGILDLHAFAADKGVLVAAPDGSRDSRGRHFWNATDACCDFDRSGADDLGRLRSLIDEVSAEHRVDPARIFVVGYSNGGFMAHRVACELGDRVAAVASFSGASFSDDRRCAATAPVAILEVHGDADKSVSYTGGKLAELGDGAAYPGAAQTVAVWAARNGCDANASATQPGPNISGKTTTRFAYRHCRSAAVELWTVHDGGHLIGMRRTDLDAAYRFLMSHPKRRGERTHAPVARRSR